MRKKLLSVVLFALWAFPVFGQSVDTAWVRMYNGLANMDDYALAIAVDGSGNTFVTGSRGGIGGTAYLTIKYLPNGDTAWVRVYVGLADGGNFATAIRVDGSGNVYETGRSSGTFTNEDYATIKYFPNGDTAWVRRYNGPGNGEDWATAIAVDGPGNVHVTGFSWGSGTHVDYATIKYFPNGDTAWVRRYDGPESRYDYANATALDDLGNVYVTGRSYDSASNHDYVTVRYNSNGDAAWVKRYNGPGNSSDEASAIAIDNADNIYVTGTSYSGSETFTDDATIKYYQNGDTAWLRRYNGPRNGADVASAMALDSTGNVYVAGKSSDSSITNWDFTIIKYYPNGDTAWVRGYNGPGNDEDRATAIVVDGSGNAYATGASVGSGTSADYATIKYFPNGDIAWLRRYNGLGNYTDVPTAITVDYSANVYVTGCSYGDGSLDWCTIKYVQFLRGDANQDKKVNVADIVYLVSYLFKQGCVPKPIQQVGDANCDEKVTVSDIVYLVAYLFKHGPQPCI